MIFEEWESVRSVPQSCSQGEILKVKYMKKKTNLKEIYEINPFVQY